jgi:DNA-binding response OmpR family regulator
MKILLIEDDPMIGESLLKALKQSGHAVNWVQDGEMAVMALKSMSYAVILLDLGIPHRSGISILTELRKKENPVPVLIITARDAPEDIALGLDSGADDYLIKPFTLIELEARMRAIVRRKAGNSDPLMTYGQLSLNPANYQIEYKGKTATLSAREFSLMRALLEKPSTILSRAQLEEVESNAVEVHIHNIRRKLGHEIIRNVRGLGYMVSV